MLSNKNLLPTTLAAVLQALIVETI